MSTLSDKLRNALRGPGVPSRPLIEEAADRLEELEAGHDEFQDIEKMIERAERHRAKHSDHNLEVDRVEVEEYHTSGSAKNSYGPVTPPWVSGTIHWKSGGKDTGLVFDLDRIKSELKDIEEA